MQDENVKRTGVGRNPCSMVLAVSALAVMQTAHADERITPGQLIIERPTLICLGFQWCTSGDDNKNAKASVKYRKVGENAWKAQQSEPLWRFGPSGQMGRWEVP